MKLIVGLGNPGAKYARHRHNIGFMALDRIRERCNLGPWRKRFQGHVAEGVINGARVLLLKPETYMNASGRSVGEAARFHKIDVGDIIVIHDELDLAPGKAKAKLGGGAAGHNGLKSITQHLSADFIRVRIGIGHPGEKSRVSGYVLHDFSKADEAWIEPLLDTIAETIGTLTRGDLSGFQTALGGGSAETPKAAATRGPGTSPRTSRRATDAHDGAAAKPKRPNQRDLARHAAHQEPSSSRAGAGGPPRTPADRDQSPAPTALADKLSQRFADLFRRKDDDDRS